MLVNEYLSWRCRRSNTEVPAGPGHGAAAATGETDATERLAARDAAWRLLATLPRRQRAVLVLRFYEDLADQEIAAVLGCAPSTVRSQAARAMNTLRGNPQLRSLLTSAVPVIEENTPWTT
jgi:RNA polymerase sigma factor (sigma-70 family)